jgi:ABC-type multidrug transport system ATPase subunit
MLSTSVNDELVRRVSGFVQPVKATGLRKTKGTTRALDGVDMHVARGEIVALLGPNGAGKTTLLHLLAGLDACDEGTVTIAGEDDPTRPAVRACIGFAPQHTAVYDELSVEENLRFFALIQGVPRKRVGEAVERGIAFAQLTDRRGARAGTLSGGMRRRLHVAVAVVHAPRVLLLDEPMVGIDDETRAQLVDAIGSLRDRGTAVVWSTHERDSVDALGARSIHMAAGRIVQ